MSTDISSSNRRAGPSGTLLVPALVVVLLVLLSWPVLGLTERPSSSIVSLAYATAVAGLSATLGVAWKKRGPQLIARTLAIRYSAEDRFLTILGYLSADRLELRLGAIYALERIARNSDRDAWAIGELLTTYVRERSRASEPTGLGVPRISKDVQAALVILGRGAWQDYSGSQRRLDLSGADLRGAELDRANLEGASLVGARLDHASLKGAVLRGADLASVDFTGADLRGADLTGASGVTAAQIASAVTDSATRVPLERTAAATGNMTTVTTNGIDRPHPPLAPSDGYNAFDLLLAHQCPKCSSRDVDRKRSRGVTDPIVFWVFNRRSYECFACGTHFYDRPRTNRP